VGDPRRAPYPRGSHEGRGLQAPAFSRHSRGKIGQDFRVRQETAIEHSMNREDFLAILSQVFDITDENIISSFELISEMRRALLGL
jgi:hypothetical protein